MMNETRVTTRDDDDNSLRAKEINHRNIDENRETENERSEIKTRITNF